LVEGGCHAVEVGEVEWRWEKWRGGGRSGGEVGEVEGRDTLGFFLGPDWPPTLLIETQPRHWYSTSVPHTLWPVTVLQSCIACYRGSTKLFAIPVLEVHG